MKKIAALFLTFCILPGLLSLVGCQPKETVSDGEDHPVRTVIALDENNVWKYLNVSETGNGAAPGEKEPTSFEITGVLDYALYEDVVLTFDVIYYSEGQKEEDYQSYSMRIGCNAAGDARFETYENGLTVASVGRLLGIDGELVSFGYYYRKIQLRSVTGNVIYTQ